MTTATMSLFFALLAVIAQVTSLTLLVLWVGGRRSARLAVARDAVRGAVGDAALGLAWTVALVSTLGSLYYSEVAGFTPCELCWYQRIAMYPLVVLLGIAAWRGDRAIARATIPLTTIGAAIATWHSLLQRFPALSGTTSCDPTAPCTAIYVWQLGYITIPIMALSGFLAITALVLVGTGRGADVDDETEEVTRDALGTQA
jgi:disulfide bond formation protein DsbB